MAILLTATSAAYTGNGVTTVFPVPFGFLENEHIRVRQTYLGAGAILTLGIHYGVSGAGAAEGTGVVTFFDPPADGAEVVLERNTPVVQDVNYRTQGSFLPDTHEASFDHRTMVEQELARRVSAIEGQGVMGDAQAGNGLIVIGSTWHVGTGPGLTSGPDSINISFDVGVTTVDADNGTPGTANAVARADHTHFVDVGDPSPVEIGVPLSAGIDSALARSDHRHSVATAAPVSVTKAANAEGSASTFARSDHKHDVSTAVPVELADSANTEGVATSMARSDHKHSHGNRAGGSLHALASSGAAGFMSAADKVKLDAIADTFAGTLTTTTAAPAVLANLVLDKKGVITIDAMVTGVKADALEGAGYRLAATFRHDGENLVQVGTTTAVATHEDDAAWHTSFSILGTAIRLMVTGEAAANVLWSARGQSLTISA